MIRAFVFLLALVIFLPSCNAKQALDRTVNFLTPDKAQQETQKPTAGEEAAAQDEPFGKEKDYEEAAKARAELDAKAKAQNEQFWANMGNKFDKYEQERLADEKEARERVQNEFVSKIENLAELVLVKSTPSRYTIYPDILNGSTKTYYLDRVDKIYLIEENGRWTKIITYCTDENKIYEGYLLTEEIRYADGTKLKWELDEEKKAEEAIKAAKRKEAEEKRKREAKIDSFGAKYAKLIREEKICMGMPAEAAIMSWGKPDKINKTVGKFGVHEQWIYGHSYYLYFENGYLTSWQEFK